MIARLITMAAGFVLAPALSPYLAAGGWIAYPAGFLIPVVALTIAMAVTPEFIWMPAISVPAAGRTGCGITGSARYVRHPKRDVRGTNPSIVVLFGAQPAFWSRISGVAHYHRPAVARTVSITPTT